MKSQNYSANFDDNCKIYSTEVLVIEINEIITYDKLRRFVFRCHLFGHRMYVLKIREIFNFVLKNICGCGQCPEKIGHLKESGHRWKKIYNQ